jgi:ureidoglycolate dehydrogenase (NAD+)
MTLNGNELMLRYDSTRLNQSMRFVLQDLGVNDASITHLVTSVIETSLRGTDSHGINLFPHYVNAINSGRINKNPAFKFERISKTTAVLNADHAVGHHSGAVAMHECIEKAKAQGMGAVAVKNSTHFGAAAYFGLMAAHEDCIGFAFTNADALVKASNAKEAFFGTNPVCFTAPLTDEGPLCLDMATSMVSWNKVNNYRSADKPLPENWAFDEEGHMTTDPHRARTLFPAGDYKGYGLGMMVDILCSVLSGSLTSKDIAPMYTSDIRERRGISHFFMAIDIKKFVEPGIFKSKLSSMVERIRNLERLTDEDVLAPGDPEKRSRVIRLKQGIPIDDKKHQEFLAISNVFDQCRVNR